MGLGLRMRGLRPLWDGIAIYAASSLFVLLGVCWGAYLLVPFNGGQSVQRVPDAGNPYLEATTRWDAQWYLRIAAEGYFYTPEEESSVAFFPAYPLLVGGLHRLTALPAPVAGLLVSHACFLGAIVLLLVYLRSRFPDGPGNVAYYAALACSLFPTTFFMRMVYTESLFLFLCLAAFVAMQRRWPLVSIALIVGLATAVRPVGVALAVAMAYHVWEHVPSWRQAAVRLAYLGPLAVWGLLAYMLFQWSQFNEPLAFVKTQQHWYLRPPVEFGERFLGLLSWEPIWSVYTPGCPGYWADIDKGVPFPFSYQLANPTAVLAAAGLLGLGVVKRWLVPCEVICGVCLLAIPYFLSGYTFCMASQGRYASVVFPVYVVLGNVFCRLPPAASAVVLAFFALYLAMFSAMFAADYYMV